ncbi:MHC class II transactivator-like [Girardinichthys multiradiatus]|uniref:MHC class II transactivator-like n=1 Tax=Girardinichthys multiradiatus TaxID=208333 RepID=UPI001FACE0F3|nr:MHC class II transactivator-like [Girardinichthys multiradiatus]
MTPFAEVLDQVRLVLTWAFPGEVQALLKGLVKEGIISEIYRKSLNLHWLNDGIVTTLTSKPGCSKLDVDFNSQGSVAQWYLDQDPMTQMSTSVSKLLASDHNVEQTELASSIEEPNSTRINLQNLSHEYELLQRNQEEIKELLEEFVMDVSYSNEELFSSPSGFDCTFRSSDEKGQLLSSASSESASDNERVSTGNLENEEEWLEQVEEAARRIAVPLWQHWDRGRGMLQTLLLCLPSTLVNDGMVSEVEAQCATFDTEEKMELAAACRTPDACVGDFECAEPSLTCDTAAGRSERGELHFSTNNRIAVLNMEDFRIHRAARSASPVEACKATDASYITEMLESKFEIFWPPDKMADVEDDLFCLTANTLCKQCGTNSGLSESTFRHLLYSGAPEDRRTVLQENSHYSLTERKTDYLQDVFRNTAVSCIDRFRELHEKTDSHGDAKMQEFDQDSLSLSDLLPDEDISNFLDDDYLVSHLDPTLLLNFEEQGTVGLDFVDEIINSDPPVALEANHKEQKEQSQPTDKIKPKRKRQRDALSKQCTDGNLRVKRQKAIDSPKTKEETVEPTVTHGADAETMPVPTEPMRGPSTTPPGIVHVFPSQSSNPIPIQLITIPDSPAYKVVQLSSSPSPLIRLPLPNTSAMPTYIFIPAPSPTCKRQVPPLSPVDGAVAPVLMSSFQPISMSDTASKAMSSPAAASSSPTNKISPCKEAPKSPPEVEIPQGVKDYIQQSKTHMSQACQHMEGGLRLSAHYVDVNVSQREMARSGKNTNRCLDKELIITGDIDRQKRSVGQSQIFDSLDGKRCSLLLGNAGMGKTTLIKKLCLDWSKDCIPQFDFVFLLDGKQLTLTEPVHSLQTLLLSRSSFAPPCMDPEGVYAQILAAPKRVLVVFDGFDELRNYEMLLQTQEKDLVASLQKDSKAQAFTVKQLFSGILQRVLLPGCMLLLAIRPRGTASQLLRRTDSFLEVCGFTSANVETYVSQYFSDPELRASALDYLKICNYLHLLCWNPGLCHLVCNVLQQCKSSDALPRTLTTLCHKVLCLKMEKDRGSPESLVEPKSQKTVEPIEETEISNNSQGRRGHKNNRTRARAVPRISSRSQRARRMKGQEKLEEENACEDTNRTESRELLSQLCSLAWEGVKSNSSVVPRERTISTKLRAFSLKAGLLLSQSLMKRTPAKLEDSEGGGREVNNGTVGVEEKESKQKGGNAETFDECEDNILLWANPFLQSYMAAVHLSLSRTVTDRSFLQTLPFQTGAKGRRKSQREELELTQRFALGLLFHNRTELQMLHTYSDTVFRDMVASKQALVMKHLEGLSFGDLSSAQILEMCNYVYEASFTHKENGRNTGGKMLALLAVHIPEFLSFRGVPLSPPDVFTVQNALSRGGAEGRSFCLDLEDSGIHICGLKALVGLSNINTYRACIADVLTLWKELEKLGDEGLLQGAVSKFKIHPLKATQVCHIEHLESLVSIHTHKRLSSSSSQSGSILADGVPAVKELYKLEFELGQENGPLALPKLWDLLPGLHNLQHLDVENSKIGDKGAEKLANALVFLRSLEILNLSENCVGDQGVKKLALALKDLPKLHCLSLYSNVISDEGAESLAAVLPHMASLTDLDVKYNKMTDVGAQSLGASLRNCKKVKTLRMWNQCIPYGVFERLQQQDSRILWH